MGHEWILDVLADLRAYAMQNGLPSLAAKTDETLRAAQAEIASRPAVAAPREPQRGPPG